jgi:hypothetical protein
MSKEKLGNVCIATGDTYLWPRTRRDRFIWWPSALAVIAVTGQLLLWQSTDLRDPNTDPLWLFPLLIPIFCGAVILAILWIGSAVVYLFSGCWRRLISVCVAPIVILTAIPQIATQYDPLHRLVNSGVLEAQAIETGLPVGERFAKFDISQGLFVPPLTLLVYDETDRAGWPNDRSSELARIGGSKSYQSLMRACIGASERVAPHYYVCRP